MVLRGHLCLHRCVHGIQADVAGLRRCGTCRTAGLRSASIDTRIPRTRSRRRLGPRGQCHAASLVMARVIFCCWHAFAFREDVVFLEHGMARAGAIGGMLAPCMSRAGIFVGGGGGIARTFHFKSSDTRSKAIVLPHSATLVKCQGASLSWSRSLPRHDEKKARARQVQMA